MTVLNDIYIHLSNYIENKNDIDKSKIMILINQHNDYLKKEEEKIIEKKQIYKTLIENIRIENDMKYNDYIETKNELFLKWKSNNKLEDLIELVKKLPPELKNIPEIYTYTFFNKKKEKPIKEDIIEIEEVKKKKKEDEIEEVKENKKKKKDDEIKEIKEDKKKKKEKEIPEDKVVNPLTGRLISKNSALAKKLGLNKK
jgi:hypothetical protein